MKYNVILSGIGGQGIVLMGELLGRAAIKKGYKVTIAPEYGQEKRGSYVHCQVTVGDELQSPVISKADSAVVIDNDSFDLFENRVKTGGRLIVNADTVERPSGRDDIQYLRIPLLQLALQVHSGKSMNMVGLGALLQENGPVNEQEILQVIRENMKPALQSQNEKALMAGYTFRDRADFC